VWPCSASADDYACLVLEQPETEPRGTKPQRIMPGKLSSILKHIPSKCTNIQLLCASHVGFSVSMHAPLCLLRLVIS
jgi:hypothetical protein